MLSREKNSQVKSIKVGYLLVVKTLLLHSHKEIIAVFHGFKYTDFVLACLCNMSLFPQFLLLASSKSSEVLDWSKASFSESKGVSTKATLLPWRTVAAMR